MAKIGLGDDRTAALTSGYVNVDGTVREITKGYIGKGDGEKEQIWPPGGAIPDSVVSRPEDDSDGSPGGPEGLEIEVKTDWPSIGAEISNKTSGVKTAYLDDSDGTTIETVDISNLSAGDAFTFDNVDLESGQKYIITVDANGDGYTRGFRQDATDFPYTSDDLDITATFAQGSPDDSLAARCINNIGNVGFE